MYLTSGEYRSPVLVTPLERKQPTARCLSRPAFMLRCAGVSIKEIADAPGAGVLHLRLTALCDQPRGGGLER